MYHTMPNPYHTIPMPCLYFTCDLPLLYLCVYSCGIRQHPPGGVPWGHVLQYWVHAAQKALPHAVLGLVQGAGGQDTLLGSSLQWTEGRDGVLQEEAMKKTSPDGFPFLLPAGERASKRASS